MMTITMMMIKYTKVIIHIYIPPSGHNFRGSERVLTKRKTNVAQHT